MMPKSSPCELKIPNKETEDVLKKTDVGENLHEAMDVKDLFKLLGI